MKLLTFDKIYIGKSKISEAGRGVFAKVDIKRGKVIETCPFIEISKDEFFKLNTLLEYLFFFGENKEKAALALGFGSLYNHSRKANATFKIKSKEKIIEFKALKDIKMADEITFDYHGSSDQESKKYPLWFEV